MIALLHKNCKYKSTNEEMDENGRRLTIQLIPVGTQGDTDADFLITNIYAPNSPTTTYYNDLTTWFAKSHLFKHVTGGYFNNARGRR